MQLTNREVQVHKSNEGSVITQPKDKGKDYSINHEWNDYSIDCEQG